MPVTVRILNLLAAVLLVVTVAWGTAIYSSLPNLLPTHWDAAGEADAFSQKGFWSVFGVLLLAAAMSVGMVMMQHFIANRKESLPVERRTYLLGLSYTNFAVTAIMVWLAFMSWYALRPGIWFTLAVILLGLPALLIVGFNMNAMIKEREAKPGGDPSSNPKFWLLGGLLYRNPDDPRTIVPKPPHTGVGATFNLATTGGKVIAVLLGLLLVGSLAALFIAMFIGACES